jgi:hypothetical protein
MTHYQPPVGIKHQRYNSSNLLRVKNKLNAENKAFSLPTSAKQSSNDHYHHSKKQSTGIQSAPPKSPIIAEPGILTPQNVAIFANHFMDAGDDFNSRSNGGPDSFGYGGINQDF